MKTETFDCFLCKAPVKIITHEPERVFEREGASAGPFGRICFRCEEQFDRPLPKKRSLNQTNPALVKYERDLLKNPPFTVLVEYEDGTIQNGPSPLKAVNKVK